MSDLDLRRQILWLTSGDTGVSSETIFEVMTGVKPSPRHWPDVPMDSADFGRCFRLLVLFPEWRPRLHEVAERYPRWSKLVEHWDELSRLHGEGSSKFLTDLIGSLTGFGSASGIRIRVSP